jgi:hypothetical protein
MNDIANKYGKFGAAVTAEISVNVNRDGDLAPLLRRFGVRGVELATPEAQHNALHEILRHYGVMFFLSVAKSDWSVDEVEKMRRNLDSAVHTPLPFKAATPGPPKPSDTQSRSSRPHVDPSLADTASGSEVKKYRSPYSLPSRPPGGSDETKPRPATNAPFIKTPAYEGPERRVLKDRRSGTQDRRLNVEMIYKNRRFGGRDRRKTVRRADDRNKTS